MKFRFFNHEAATGPWNMAIDETLGNSLGQNPDAPFLRIYRWNPPTLSFGYNQKLDGLIVPAAALEHGYGLVRRATGGKMVFHNLELTFSLGFSSEFLTSIAKNNFLQMFIAALEPLVEALKLSGVPAEFATPQRQRNNRSVHCYAAAAGHSIYAEDKKLIGAAALQRKSSSLSVVPVEEAESRKKSEASKAGVTPNIGYRPAICKADYMMIHGSIPIKSTYPAKEIFIRPIDSAIPMAELSNYLTHEQILALPDLIATTYQKRFDLPLHPGNLSPAEKDQATWLTQNKYPNPNWPHP